ncbi:MAG: hypothetical protein KGI97_02410 [Alphaproteobacteria bacterium]|nr:hypothetical protein [Alphaproteobacteria bacterium]
MQYEDLHHRYGTHVSQRVKRELTPSEFNQVSIDNLPSWLEARADAAHETYRHLLSNPLAVSNKDQMRAGEACRRWRAAEDLAYLVVIAEDVSAAVRVG